MRIGKTCKSNTLTIIKNLPESKYPTSVNYKEMDNTSYTENLSFQNANRHSRDKYSATFTAIAYVSLQ